MRYLVFDRETENHEVNKRFASPFSDLNWTVALGWKHQGDERCSWAYFPTKEDEHELYIADDVDVLVGHNIKFDLLHGWNKPSLKKFLKRGGRIWCTQYAEYLLSGAHPDSHMVSMDAIVEKYGGRKKIDAVKALWESGMLTSQIDEDLLIDYLVGTEEENRNSGDIGNTELIYLGQLKRAAELDMMTMIQQRMDGLLCTTEMEYNGLKIDVKEAQRRMDVLTEEVEALEEELSTYIPELPPELTFNWQSIYHKSALIFGGTVKYRKKTQYIDPKTGELARFKVKQSWPLFNKTPVDPATPIMFCDNGIYYIEHDGTRYIQDVHLSGKNKGLGKFKTVTVPGDFKERFEDFFFTFDGYTTPDPSWASSLTDAAGVPIYSTNGEVIDTLAKTTDIPFLKALGKRQDLYKDLSTYYVRYDPKKKEYVGMLTCVHPTEHIVHHNLNHTTTVTTRLSSNSPNLQNIPRDDRDAEGNAKSEVKRMFVSRFGDEGYMIEIDYSQLEVIIQGMLTGDKQLCEDIRNGVDFHCKRVALKHNISYEEAVRRCKIDDTAPDFAFWKKERTKCKIFSFQRAYGAGAVLIAESTGMDIEEVKELMVSEDLTYPGVPAFNKMVENAVKSSAVPFRDWETNKVYHRGYYRAPTGTMYTFRSYDAQDWQADRGVTDTFSPTEMKNYPVQGTGGELVQMVLGKLFRHFVHNDNYGNLAFLCNTVHDCVWFDAHESVAHQVAADAKRIMESIPELLKDIFGIEVQVPFPCEVEMGRNLLDKKHV